MNLQQFLEEEIIDFSIDFGHARNCDVQPPNDGEQMCSCGYEQVESEVKNMNTSLINKVLSEVKREIEKEVEKIVDNRHPELGDAGADCECAQCMFSCGRKIGRKDISTIIDQLKLK